MQSLDTLNEPQRQAVLHGDGPLVVFAGAGSGKTRVITYRVAQLIENGARPWRVLAVTFTNKAAGEMRERLTHLLGATARDIWVGTFHAVCARLLRKHHDLVGLSRNFVIYDDGDQRAMITRVINDLGFDEKRFGAKQVASMISRAKQDLIGPDKMPSGAYHEEIVKKIYTAYEARMLAAGALDFDDLLYRTVRAADEVPAFSEVIRGAFDQVLVDEFQDTNRVQFRFVETLVKNHGNLCVVGDDDQSIYRWRGADRRNILDFRRTFPNAEIIKLEQNYRSTKRILRAAHAVVSRNMDREPKTLWTDNDEGTPVLAITARDERDEARLAVETIREAARANHAYADVAIFYRIHAQSRVFEEALRTANIPYRIVGGQRFYDRAEVKDILGYLRVLVHPSDDVSVLRILNVPARGIGKTTVDKILDAALRQGTSVWETIVAASKAGDATAKKLARFVELIEALQERLARGEGPSGIAKLVVSETGYRKALTDQDSAEADARLENIDELIGSIQEFEEEAETPTLSSFLETVTLDAGQEKDGITDRVTMMSVHASKGLEFPIVFVGGMEEKMFPYRGVEAGEDPEELEEERRLAYVAFTRAREKLLLSWAPQRQIFGQTRISRRSRFLDEIPRADMQEIGLPVPTQSSPSYARRYDHDEWDVPQTRPSRPAASYTRSSTESYIDHSEGDLADQGPRPGMSVAHAKYGVGKVLSVAPGSPPKVSVSFPGWGEKQILASFLEPA